MRKHSQLAGDHKSSGLPTEHLWLPRKQNQNPGEAWVLLTMAWWSTAGAGPAVVQGLAFCVEKTSSTEKISSILGTWRESLYKMTTR